MTCYQYAIHLHFFLLINHSTSRSMICKLNVTYSSLHCTFTLLILVKYFQTSLVHHYTATSLCPIQKSTSTTGSNDIYYIQYGPKMVFYREQSTITRVLMPIHRIHLTPYKYHINIARLLFYIACLSCF